MALLSNQHTEARLGIERSGHSTGIKESFNFKLDHARARDAVYSNLDVGLLKEQIESTGSEVILLKSKAPDRETYLKRPDYGRVLSQDSLDHLSAYSKNYDVLIIVADGLSAIAIQGHFLPMIRLTLSMINEAELTLAPICIVEQGRVAIGDQIGEILKSKLSVLFIGERPGLSSPNSMGCYLTYQPKTGLTDESRNCISNIRNRGLPYKEAAEKLLYLIRASLKKQISGTGLKDEQNLLL